MRHPRQPGRPGSILPLVAISMIALFGMVALAIDIGVIAVARTQVQSAADAGALAGARTLNGDATTTNNVANAQTAAQNGAVSSGNTDGNMVTNTKLTTSQVTATPNVYSYNSTSQQFQISYPAPSTLPTGQAWSAMTVSVGMDTNNKVNRPTFFGKIFSFNSYNVQAVATAVHRPRDIAFVLDFSGSMRFSSTSSYPPFSTVTGSMNPDQRIPSFGPWSTMNSALQRTTDYTWGAYVLATNNQTMDSTNNGPRIVGDFYYKDSGGNFVKAFDNAAQTDSAYSTSAVPVTPAPTTFGTQADSPVTYDGDKWPRDTRATTGTSYAKSVLDYLTSTGQTSFGATSWSSVATTTTAGTKNYNYSATSSANNVRVTLWSPALGNLSAGKTYAPTNLSTTSPSVNGMTTPSPNSPNTWAEPLDPTNPGQYEGYGSSFKGYSMGPAYWGKTFYVWPPDPRYNPVANLLAPNATQPAKDTAGLWMADWRKRFFVYGSSNTRMDDNSLLWDSSGNWKAAGSSTYKVDYVAVLAWIKAGPQTLPANLRSGRVLYYSSIPSDVDTSSGTADQKMDKFFWKSYIDYVIGSNLGGNAQGNWGDKTWALMGTNTSQGFGTTQITAKSSLTNSPNISGTDPSAGPYTGPKPYMRYDDNPIHPRQQFWFGPQTMLDYIGAYGFYFYNWWPGTCHEAHCWHLKAGIQSAFNDIQNNHPNDWASLIYFSDLVDYSTPRVTLGRNYTRMKNALWYPFTNTNNGGTTKGSFLDLLDAGDTATEIRPYDTSFNSTSDANIPNANGGTSPHMGFMTAYNQLSSRSSSPGPFNGRHGASKVVVFETDGVPNTTCNGSYQGGGAYNAYYSTPSSMNYFSDNDPNAQNPALAVVATICASDQASGSGTNSFGTTYAGPGYTSSRSPARVHAMAFGQLFETTTTTSTTSLNFLLHVQQNGNTSSASDTSIESYKIITGDYNTRIDKIRQALQRIMQSGVQVALIQ
jgi:Flp pilus assembly protein TadG